MIEIYFLLKNIKALKIIKKIIESKTKLFILVL